MSNAVTTRLQQAEEVIEHGIAGYRAAGEALREIRDDGLYKSGFETFEEYCKVRWGWERAHAYRLIDASAVAINCLPLGDISNERQARELAKLSNAELQRAAYGVAETISKQNKAGKVTAKTVAKAVELVHKIIANNPSIKPDDIAAKAVEHGAVESIEPHEESNEEIVERQNELLRESIDVLNEQLTALKDRQAISVEDIPEYEKINVVETIDTLRAELKTSKAVCESVIIARDNLMRENLQLKRQIAMLDKKLKAK